MGLRAAHPVLGGTRSSSTTLLGRAAGAAAAAEGEAGDGWRRQGCPVGGSFGSYGAGDGDNPSTSTCLMANKRNQWKYAYGTAITIN
jgi:hypothetical protein